MAPELSIVIATSNLVTKYYLIGPCSPRTKWFDSLQSQYTGPQIEYKLGGTSKKSSHVYFLLIVAMVLVMWHHIVLLWCQNNISIKQ